MAINDLRRLREISQGTLETLTHAMEPLGTWEHDLQDSLQQSAQQALASWRTELHRAEDHWNTLRQRAQLQHQLAEMVADLDARLLVGQQQLEQLAAAARMLAEERDAARESLNILEKESGPGTRELRLQLDQLNAAERRLSRRETETRSALATLTERQQQQNLQLPRLDHDLQAAARRADEQRERRLTLQTRHPDLSEVDQDSLFERLTGRSVTQLREEAERASEQVQQVFIAEKGALETPHSFQPVLSEGVPVFGLGGLRATGEQLRAHLEEELLQTRALLSREEAATFQGELIRELVGDLFAKQRAAAEWVQRVQRTLKKISFNGEQLGLEQAHREVAGSVSEPLSRLVDGHTDPYFAPDAWWTSVSSEVRQIIDGLRALPGADLSFAQAFEQALDYRQWIAFRFLSVVTQPGGTSRRRDITDRNFSERSGGERSAVLYAFLFAAVAARFDQLGSGVPRLIGLDEAFAGMDTGNIGSLYRIMADLELSWVLTSQHPVHLNPDLPAAAAYEFFRVSGKEGDSLGRLGSLWNGRTQTRLGG
ncbi:SbcC/MukB-like Walker B domain-containing protein (plasmid) [Deinococcus radiomollis]|uniref:SbcC/MukB-like Walker B domain-containing protein n=1 Tax=Deinococcus radiomollis TaxID=468916 RepID=UPI003891CA9B